MPLSSARFGLIGSLALGLTLGLGGCGETPKEPVDEPEVAPHVGDPLAEADAFIARKKISKQYADWRLRLPKPPRLGFPTDKKIYWRLETNKGPMLAELWHDKAPLHVSSVIYLSRLGFYDGLTFHRVIRGFMAQGGDPQGDGAGWPGYSMPVEISPGLRHDERGILSTANAGRPNTDGSQFFIMFRSRPELDGKYTIYGKVIEGLDTIDKLEVAGALSDPGRPRERLVIERATVEVK